MPDIVTPNMGLTIPTIGTTLGPTYAIEVNNDLSIMDSHNHTTGLGVPIPTAGISLNADLPFNGVNATLLRSTRFSPQGAVLALGSDLRCLYAVGADLYFNDGNSVPVRITQSGGVAGSPGSIGNLVSPASAQYVSGSKTFIWQSDVNIPANMDAGSYILRGIDASGNGLTLNPPVLSGNYSLTLPPIPSANGFLGLDTSGNITSVASQSFGIARTNMVAVGQQVSPRCIVSGATADSGASFNMLVLGTASVTITTTGRPVMLMVQPSTSSALLCGINATPNRIFPTAMFMPSFTLQVTRGGSSIANFDASFGSGQGQVTNLITQVTLPGSTGSTTFVTRSNSFTYSPPPYLDVVGAGTYTYSLQIVDRTTGSATYVISNLSLVAYEL